MRLISALLLALAAALALGPVSRPVAQPTSDAAVSGVARPAVEVVATGVPRPLQLLWDGSALLVLSPGVRGEYAAEIYRVAVDGEAPADLARQPRTRVPFADAQATTMGSLALEPASRALFMGEENGRRVWRLGADGRITLYASGLRRLPGGSSLVFDRVGRLFLVDYVDPYASQSDDRPPPGLEQLRDEEYRGPLVLRLSVEPGVTPPRRLGHLAPLYPRGWGGKSGGALLPVLIAMTPLPGDEMALLSSTGQLYRLSGDGTLTLFTRLPPGDYNRVSMATGEDGTVFVSGGFHAARVFRVTTQGAVSVLAANLADPQGIALDDRGFLYVAESSRHRILRVSTR